MTTVGGGQGQMPVWDDRDAQAAVPDCQQDAWRSDGADAYAGTYLADTFGPGPAGDEEEHVTWSGRHRPKLTGQGVYPRPKQDPLPIWIAVGGTPNSVIRAGVLGLPLLTVSPSKKRSRSWRSG